MEIGEMNTMEVYKKVDFGYFLADEEDEVLLPNNEVSKSLEEGERVDVFIYHDDQNRPVATTIRPKIKLYEFAALQCVAVSRIGAFMDWGLSRDLLIPNREMFAPMKEGEYYLCYLFLDMEDRLTGSTQIDRIVDNSDLELEEKQEVDIVIWEETPLGYKVIINHVHHGLVYHDGVFKNLFPGKPMKAYIKKIRPDNTIDVSLEKIGFKAVEDHTERILEVLRDNGGVLHLHDKSDPELIKSELHISKKVFKKAIGILYRQRKIVIHKDHISLVGPAKN